MRIDLLLIFLAACGAAAATGVIFQPGAWYEGLAKPSWTPPRIAFPIVWTTLYLLAALAAARVAPLPGAGVAIGLWALQIALNTLWTPTFFGAHRMGMGLVVIILLWLTLAATIVAFWRLDRLAAIMLVPYLGWISVATALNGWIWRANPGASMG